MNELHNELHEAGSTKFWVHYTGWYDLGNPVVTIRIVHYKSNIKICFQKILNFSSFGIFWHSVGSECSDGSRSLQEVDLINIFYLLNVHNFLWITLIEILSIFLFYKQKVRGLSNSCWTASLPRLRNRLEKSGKSAVFLNIYHLGYTLHCTLYKYNS